MLTVSQLTKSYGGRVLFEDASLQINANDRIGLIGANGAGKSTLFSLILKENAPDAGSVNLQRGSTLGYLPQESAPSGDETILELATSISAEMAAVQKALRDFLDEDAAEHHEAHAQFVELDGYGLEAKAKHILNGLAFRESDFNRPARTMSGGWIMRAHLARLLVMEPDLLMLDEPTNHLDLESLGWFQSLSARLPRRAFWSSPTTAPSSMPSAEAIVEIAPPAPAIATPATMTPSWSRKRPARNNTFPPTRTSSARSRTWKISSTAFAPRPARPRKPRNASSAWKNGTPRGS